MYAGGVTRSAKRLPGKGIMLRLNMSLTRNERQKATVERSRDMKTTRILISITAAVVLAAASRAGAARPVFDNFVLLVDQSAEMHGTYHGKSKNHLARQAAKQFIKQIPSEISLSGAMYMYGIMASSNDDKVVRVLSMEPFNRARFLSEYEELKAQTGPSSLSIAIREARRDLEAVPGKTAVIIISGGNLSDVGEPGTETKKLKEAYGDKVCVFTVLVGKSKRGGENLNDLVRKGKCGFAVDHASVDDSDEMSRYVRAIFFGAGEDEDIDGVPDKDDECSRTPFGASVDERGCWVVRDIRFDPGKSDIKPDYYDMLDEIAAVMNANPELKILIEGHTDSQGDEDYNRELSRKRADSVKEYLINAEVDPFRLQTAGKGESEPVASNDTPEGRAKNRRIEFDIRK